MAYYDKFNRLDTLNIIYSDSPQNAATIYGNGRNQVEVQVVVKIIDKNNNPVEMSKQEMLDSIYLCDYETGQHLLAGSGDDWNYSREKNQYLGALEYSPTMAVVEHNFSQNDGYNHLSLYLYSKRQSDGKVVAAGINILTVGAFETTAHGTATGNGPGGKGTPFKMPIKITAKALAPYKYTIDDFSLSKDTYSLPDVWDKGAKLYEMSWTNYYLDIKKNQYNISSLYTGYEDGTNIGSFARGWKIGQLFDFSREYGKAKMSKTVQVHFSKYLFPCTSDINLQRGACFTLVYGVSTMPTPFGLVGDTTGFNVTIFDQYGNQAVPLLLQNEYILEIIGMSPQSHDAPEVNGRYSDHGVPENIVQYITDSAPAMICGVLTQDDNTSDFILCANTSPVPEQGAMIDTDALLEIMNSHELTHVVCSVPDALSHDVVDYQIMSDRDGLNYLLVFWPSLACLNISPQIEFGYEGRPYIYGQYDCYSLVREYLLREKGVVLNDYPRQLYSRSLELNIFETQAPEEGFVRVEDGSLQQGDLLMLNLPTTGAQCVAVYAGSGQMLHHFPPGQSRQEAYSESWRKRTSSVWRHKQLMSN